MALTKPKLSQNIDTDVSVFSDPILVLHQGSMSANVDVGFLMNRSNGLTANAAVVWQESSKSFVHILTNDSGAPDANLTVQSYANVSVGNVLLINNAGIYVDGTLGTNGQILQSDGSKTYWGPPGGFTGGTVANPTVFQSNLVISNTTASTSNVTGALVVLGGVGVAGNVYANVLYTTTGIRWAGNGNVFASGGGGAGLTYTANTAPPATGNIAGDQWYNTTRDVLYEYLDDGTNSYWVDVISPVISSDSNANVIITGSGSTSGVYNLSGTTTNATETELFVGNVTNSRIAIASNTTVVYDVTIAARRTDTTGYSAGFNLKGVVDNFSGNVADVGNLYENILARDDVNYLVDARADNTNDSLNIYVTGVAGHTIKWVATVTIVEVQQ
jgi:hypothetical protein